MGANSSSCCHEERGVPTETIRAQSSAQEQLPEGIEENPEAVKAALAALPQQAAAEGPGALRKSEQAQPRTSQSNHVGWIKMNSFSQLEVDQDILRSVSLRKTLRRGGRLWRKSPLDLPEEERKALWDHSQATPILDVFLSHTWRTSGRWKVLALLLQSGWVHLLLFWWSVMALVVALYAAEVLPRPFESFEGIVLGQRITCRVGPWLMASYLPAIFLGALGAVYLPEWRVTRSFLDVVCIHQVDEKLMLRGIYGLGGFLARASELRVLWSQPYFSRKWCVFEMAAYRAANPSGRIRMAPLFLEVTILALWISVYFTTWLMYAAGAVNSPLNSLFPFPLAIAALLPMLVATHALRRLIASKQTLVEELANFDVDKADCRLDFDSQFVNTAIEAWYGSKQAFNEYVRGTLRQELVGQATHVPLAYFLLFIAMPMLPGTEITVGMWLDGLAPELVWARMMAWQMGFGIGSQLVSLKLLFYLCDRFAAPRLGCGVCNLAQSFVIFLAYMICDLGSYSMARFAIQRLDTSAIYGAFMLCVAGLCHRKSLRQWLS